MLLQGRAATREFLRFIEGSHFLTELICFFTGRPPSFGIAPLSASIYASLALAQIGVDLLIPSIERSDSRSRAGVRNHMDDKAKCCIWSTPRRSECIWNALNVGCFGYSDLKEAALMEGYVL